MENMTSLWGTMEDGKRDQDTLDRSPVSDCL